MPIGDGRVVRTTAMVHPSDFGDRVGAHVHKGSAESTVGGPGCTSAPGASLAGSAGSSPYGSAGDGTPAGRDSDGDYDGD